MRSSLFIRITCSLFCAVFIGRVACAETMVSFEGFTNKDGVTHTLSVNGEIRDLTVNKRLDTVNGVDQFVYRISYTGEDYNGDSKNDTLSFELRVEGFTGGLVTTSEDITDEVELYIGSASVGQPASVVNSKRVGGKPFSVGGTMKPGDSLQFSVANVSVDVAGYSATLNGFSGFQIRETGASYGHMAVVGTGGPGLLTVRTNGNKHVTVGSDVLHVLTVSSAAGVGSNPQRWGVQGVKFDVTVSRQRAGIPEPASYGFVVAVLAVCSVVCRRRLR